jgi:hypothetical protein
VALLIPLRAEYEAGDAEGCGLERGDTILSQRKAR